MSLSGAADSLRPSTRTSRGYDSVPLVTGVPERRTQALAGPAAMLHGIDRKLASARIELFCVGRTTCASTDQAYDTDWRSVERSRA